MGVNRVTAKRALVFMVPPALSGVNLRRSVCRAVQRLRVERRRDVAKHR
jgi:hypothetical protein